MHRKSSNEPGCVSPISKDIAKLLACQKIPKGAAKGTFYLFVHRGSTSGECDPALAACIRVHFWPIVYPFMRLHLRKRCSKRQSRLLESLSITQLLVWPSATWTHYNISTV